mmetsp:Transcript_322/g.898  ORF Transcript_322/g.898 Transcript_322/m.898 type:complete len:217 (+) Transcript_322:17-667(+)
MVLVRMPPTSARLAGQGVTDVKALLPKPLAPPWARSRHVAGWCLASMASCTPAAGSLAKCRRKGGLASCFRHLQQSAPQALAPRSSPPTDVPHLAAQSPPGQSLELLVAELQCAEMRPLVATMCRRRAAHRTVTANAPQPQQVPSAAAHPRRKGSALNTRLQFPARPLHRCGSVVLCPALAAHWTRPATLWSFLPPREPSAWACPELPCPRQTPQV